MGAPGLVTTQPTPSKEIRNSELKECPALIIAAPVMDPPLPATRVGCSEGAGPAQQPARKRGSRLILWSWASGRREQSPPRVCGGALAPWEGRGEGEATGAPGHSGRVCCRGPRRPGAGFVCGISALGRRQPGYKMAGKGWDRRRSPRGAPRSACTAAGGGAGVQATLRAPHPAPANDGPPHPAGDPAPLCPRRLCLAAAASASLRRAPAAAAAENGCQSGASRHAATGGGRRRSPPAASLPSPARGLSAGSPDTGGHQGAGAAAGGEWAGGGAITCRWRGNGVPGGQCRRALTVCPPNPHDPCPHEFMASGWENANWLLTSVTACRPHPCRYRGPQPTPTPVWELAGQR